MLRDDVADALADDQSPLNRVAEDWRSLLFPDADNARFADSYAQTVTFALLLAKSEGADVSDLNKAIAGLDVGHTLLSRALQVLTDTRSRAEIEPSLVLLQRVVNAFPTGAMQPTRRDPEDPWLYFYEHFLAAYDPRLRRDSGVYYTPVEVVRCQVALVDDLLRNRLGRAGGFANRHVVTLDPAVGTGTYLLGVIDRALDATKGRTGAGSVGGKATALAANLYGFELMTGPYAVSELRLARALRDRGATLPFRDGEGNTRGVGVYLADTLESPHGVPPNLPQFFQPIAESHAKALDVKDRKAVIVCLGNPPYDRHDAVRYAGSGVAPGDRARTGGWVRWGDAGDPSGAILSAFSDPARAAGHGGDLKNLYNLYVYFWRWAMWKVFEHPPEAAPGRRAGRGENAGVAAFISASSYIRGDAFVGMREMLRRLCHEVWIIDLGGEGRGTRRDDNVFNIQTPVAICIAVRDGAKDRETPAAVRYAAIRGTREEKYARLAAIEGFDGLSWKDCPAGWHAPLRPAGTGPYFGWPQLADLMPWQSNGVKVGRTWPIAPEPDVLRRRWRALAASDAADRKTCFKNSPTGRKIKDTPLPLRGGGDRLAAVKKLARGAACGPIERYIYRSFDRQYIIEDARVIDRASPSLWLAHSDRQLYMTTLFSQPLGDGPAVIASAHIPDLDTFRGSYGAKATFPLYRDAAATEPNILPNFLGLWGGRLRRGITPEAFAAYVYALTAHGAFVERFWGELEDCQLRIPLTLRADLYDNAVELGSRLLFLHTYAERYAPGGRKAVDVPTGKARNTEAISGTPSEYPERFEYIPRSRTLRVGDGAIAPVDGAVWGFEVSGFRVVDAWLGYRMKERKRKRRLREGERPSPLDDIRPERWTGEFTDELLRLLWIIEHSLAMRPGLAGLFDAVCAGPLLPAADLPAVPAHTRRPPRAGDGDGLFDADNGGDDAGEAEN